VPLPLLEAPPPHNENQAFILFLYNPTIPVFPNVVLATALHIILIEQNETILAAYALLFHAAPTFTGH
jgi:hypothetical protein